MAYVTGRLVHDADSHVMEPSDCLDAYLSTSMRERFHASAGYRARIGRPDHIERVDKAKAVQSDAAFRAGVDDNILLRKNFEAHGAFIAKDRPHVMDQLGFASQLVFSTFCLGNFGLDKSGEMDLCYAAADAQNRMMADFCSSDRRLLAVAYVPLEDFDRTLACAKAALDAGAKALMIPSMCPVNHAPSHLGLEPLWALAQEAGVPMLFHVGGEDKLNPVYKVNGGPEVKDFHGGDDNFTSVSYMPIPASAMQTMATLIFDGVFDRYPNLKWGAIELGASWLPGWMRSMDSAAHAFQRNEERLQKLSAKPSEIVRRQLRVAPYPHEEAGWIIMNSGPETCMFSSDYPHVEGGRNPLKRFDQTLEGCTRQEIDGFYAENFIDLMGKGLAEDLRRPAHLVAAE